MLVPTRHSLVVLASLGLFACGAPVVGEWESDSKLGNGKRNELTLFDDESGEGTIYATPASDPAAWTTFEFEVEWTDNVDQFDLEMKCDKGPCNGDNFDMECEVIVPDDGTVDKLDCKAEGKWSKYPFDFERLE
jgi:hypothetical protein